MVSRETALPSRSWMTSLVVATAMLLAAMCATPAPTVPFAPRLDALSANLDADIAIARIALLEQEIDVLQRQQRQLGDRIRLVQSRARSWF